MKRYLFGFLFLVFGLAAAGCNKSPFDRTQDASNGGATGTITGNAALVVFNSELVTGGGAFLYPGGENQTLSFTDTSNPISHRSIRYSWTGGDVSAPGCTPNPLHTFAGFDLMHVVDNTASLSIYNSTPGRDLSKAGYSRVTFFARGSLSTNTVLKIEAAGAGTPAGCPIPPVIPCVTLSTNGMDDDPNFPCGTTKAISGNWQSYTISLTPASLKSIKDFFKATFVFKEPPASTAPGQGGIVYFDVIQYQP